MLRINSCPGIPRMYSGPHSINRGDVDMQSNKELLNRYYLDSEDLQCQWHHLQSKF